MRWYYFMIMQKYSYCFFVPNSTYIVATFIVNCLNIAYSKKVAEISQKKEKVYYDSAIYLSHSTRALVTYYRLPILLFTVVNVDKLHDKLTKQ